MPAATAITLADAKAALASFDWKHWKAELEEKYAAWHDDVVQTEGRATAEALGGDWTNDDPYVTRFADRYVAERVTQLDDTTRGDLRDVLTRAFAAAHEGETSLSLLDLAGQLREKFDEFSSSRAATIARTETAIVENQGAALGYIASGYGYVEISDGDSDAECAEADGQIWSVEAWLAEPVAHPNCERSGAPISEEDALAAGIDRE